MPADSTPSRISLLDMFRGSAVLLMLVYHFCFDLQYFGIVRFNFQSDPFWLIFRAVIVSGFVLAVGVSLALSTRNGLKPWRFVRRQAILGAAAAMVSLSTYLLFPATWVVFGILHFIFVGRMLALFFLRFHAMNLLFALLFLLAGLFLEHPVFNHPWLHWLGMMTHKPFTEDYVPVLPWFGVLLLGIPLGKMIAQGRLSIQSVSRLPSVLAPVSWLGRNSLAVYLLHQPLFMGILYIILR
ncbi:heparan-alpha-glucosaminide N-acetyltransferase [Desulfonatronum parangueonense]